MLTSGRVRVWGIPSVLITGMLLFMLIRERTPHQPTMFEFYWWQQVNGNGWKLAISAMWWHNLQAATPRPIVKWEIDVRNGALACSEWNSLSGYCQVRSRPPVKAFFDVQSSLRGFQITAWMLHLQPRIIAGHLTASIERISFQTSKSTVV